MKRYNPKAVVQEWSKLTMPSFRFFNRALFAVMLFTVLFAGYFALCEWLSINVVDWLYSL